MAETKPVPPPIIPDQNILKELFVWTSASRPYKQRSREYITTLGSIAFLVITILMFLKEWFLIFAVIAVTFVTYVINFVKPEQVEYKITNRGVITGQKIYAWSEMTRFWFEEKWGQKMVLVETIFSFPPRLMMLFDSKDEEKIKQLLIVHLPLEKPENTWMDNAAGWLTKNIPLEKN